MTSESRHHRVESLFLEALDLPPAERATFLDKRCAGDAALRAELEDLLRRDQVSGASLSDVPAFAAVAAPPPSEIGAYKLGAKLGEGGFGEVYEAEQSAPVRRRVAIKILKPGMDSRAVLARFEAERQALALMDHPGIAKVFDAGVTETGRSYFVMERVVGESITHACDEGKLSLRARLELFVAACRAVEHAHTKGVIHRDLKPSNILVATVDGVPQPKIIDFGIAKATSAAIDAAGFDLGPRTVQGEILGTPEYMSPEQAASRGADVDTRSDIYSLGVVLFRMLTGRVPFPTERLRAGDFEAMRRILLEEEPPKPSEVAGQVGATPGTLTTSSRELRGDLDWIVLRALEKERSRRYPSAAALADDVERHLRDQPVEAGAPTTMYRLGKLVRRHRVLVTSGAAVAIALLAGIVATTRQAVRASRAEERAVLEAEVATAVNDFVGRMLAAGNPQEEARGRDLTLREVIERAAAQLNAQPPRIPAVEAGVRHTLGKTFSGLGAYEDAELQLAVADSIRSGADRPTRGWVETKLERASVLALRGRHGAADSLLRALAPAFEPFAQGDPSLRAQFLTTRGSVLSDLGELAESDSLLAQALAMRRAIADSLAGDTGAESALAFSLSDLAVSKRKLGRLEEAEALARESLEQATRTQGATHFDVASAQTRLATVLESQGRYAEADSVIAAAVVVAEAVLGPDHRKLGELLGIRGRLLTTRGSAAEGEALLRRGVRIMTSAGLIGTVSGATMLDELASSLQLQGKLEETLALRLQAIEIERTVQPNGRAELATNWNNLGSTYRLMQRYAQAESAFVAAIDGFRNSPNDSLRLFVALHNLGKTRLDRGHAEQAEETLREAGELGPKVLPDGHPNRAIFATTYGRALAAVGRTDDARRWLTEGRDGLMATFGPEHARTKEAVEALQRLDGP